MSLLMTLSDVSIRHPVFAWMLMIGLLVFGAISYSGMGISQLPDVDFPVITVTVTWAGASPDVMESAVADVIEDAVMSVDGTQLVQSTSQEGSTQVRVQFNLNQDINVALEEVQTKVSQAQRNLPQNIDPPVINKTNPEDQPILWVAVYGATQSLRNLSLFVRDHLKDSLTTVSGVGDVMLGGYVDPQMRIWFDNQKMVKKQITSQDIIDAVNAGNILSPTGYQDKGAREALVRVHSEFRNAEQCSNLEIPSRSGQLVWTPLRIKDVARCEEGTDEIRRISRFKGIEPTIGLGVIKQHGTNAVAIADAVKKRVQQLKAYLPKGLDMGLVADTTDFIRQSINGLIFTLGVSVLLTSVVCYLFLGTWSSSLNVILAIPVSLVGSLIFLKALGFTLNSFTLMGLALSIGIVVDDAIMVLENIVRHHDEGMNRVKAALVGAREITTAAIAASIAILAIFVPVVFMQGIVGKFFYQFGVTLSVAVMLSLLEALTLTPMRCSQFLTRGGENRVTTRVNRGMAALSRVYRRLLERCLNWRWTVVGVAMGVFFLSLLVAGSLRKEFLPPQDQSRFLVTLYTPMGSSIQFTDGVFRRAETWLASRPEVDNYYVAVGGFGGGLVNQGIIFVTMKDPKHRPVAAPFEKRPTQQDFMGELRKEFGKIQGVDRVSLLDLSLTGFSAQRGYPIEFELQGPDWGRLTQLSVEMRKRLASSGMMSDVDSDYNPNMPEIEVIPNGTQAKRHGVTVAAISNTVAAMVGGLKLLPNKYTDASGHRDDIQVKLVAGENQNPADIAKLWVRSLAGEMVPLKDLITLNESKTLLTITRYNRERGIGIFGNFQPGKSQSDVIAFIQATAKDILPQGYFITLTGSSQAFGESFRSLIEALVLGIFVAYMVLASQFNSFLHPVTILLALPFSVTGALLAMRVTDTSLNIYSLIGILLLMGIVKKNSILLVDFTNARRRTGLGVRTALLEACPVRLRPILMTSIATIAGAIPEAAALGPGAEIIRPMAIAVIGGVLLSTLLTLFVVPCAYSLFSRLEGHRHQEELKQALSELGEERAA
jgi:hydrophobe/amphiphile efflux-1 (HAE1) family protein